MKTISSTLTELRAERNRLDHAIAVLEGISGNGASRPKRKLSAAGRARIVAAQRARWSAVKAKRKKR